LLGVGALVFAVGSGVAYWMYILQKGAPAKQLADNFPALHNLLLNKWKVDELYKVTVLDMVDALAETAAAVDQWIVDGIIAKFTALIVAAFGTVLRALQNGVVHVYAAMMVVGFACIGWFFVMPHAEVVTSELNGEYTLTAAPGMGYSYVWSGNGR